MRESRTKLDHTARCRLAGVLLSACVFAFLVTPAVQGVERGKGDTTRVRELMVPFEDLHVILQGDKERVLLSRDEYEELMDKAKKTVEKRAPRPAVPVSAEYRVAVQEDRAVIKGTLVVDVADEGLHGVPLVFGGVGLRSAVMDGKPAAIGRSANGGLRLFVEGLGRHQLSIGAVTPLVTGAARQVLNLQLPTPSSTRLFVTVPGDVEVRSGAAVVSRVFDAAAAETRFELLPRKGQLSMVMSLNSRLKRRDRVVVARSVVVDEVTEAYERLHATVSFDILHRAVDDLRIAIPASFEVTDVRSPHLSRWAMQRDEESGTLDIKLRAETVGTVVLNISAVRSSPGLKNWKLPFFDPKDVVGHAAVVGLLVEDRLEVQSIEPTGLIPIDATVIKAALPRTVLDGEAGAAKVRPVTAYYAPNSKYGLTADFVRLPADFLVTANFVMQVKDAGLEINGGLSLLPREEKLFNLDLMTPAGWRVTSVTEARGSALPFERYDADGGDRIRIRLPKGVAAGESARIAFKAQHVPHGWFETWQSTSIDFPVFVVSGAEKDRGAVAVAAGDDMVVRPGTVSNLLPLDQNEKTKFGLAGVPTSLAYSYRGHPYAAGILVERMTPRLTAETYSFYRLERDAAIIRYELIYEVTQARARKAVFSLPNGTPASLSVTGLNGTEVKEYSSTDTEDRRIWTATLAEAQKGAIHLAVDLVLPMPEDNKGNWALPVVLAEDVTYQSGMIAVEGNAELDVRVLKHPRKVDVGELVDAEYEPGRRLLGAYNFVGAPQVVEIGVNRRSPCFLPPAIVERAEMATTISTDGKSQSAMRFLVRSQAQFIEIKLPGGSTLWSASVDGEPTKPRREGESVLLSLPARGNVVRDVKVVFETPMKGLRFWDKVSLDAPRLFFHRTGAGAGTEVPVADLKWDIFLPRGYEVGASSGTVVSRGIRPTTPAAIEVARWLYEASGEINFRRGLVGGCVMTAGHLAASSEVRRGRGKYTVNQMDSGGGMPVAPQAEGVVLFDAAPSAGPQPALTDVFALSSGQLSAPEGRRVKIVNRLKSIKIPEIDFRQANIHDVVNFLSDASVEFDTVSREGDVKGVNLVLNLGQGQATAGQAEDPFASAGEQAAVSHGGVAPITFSARYLDLYEALKIVTDVANLKFRVSDGGTIMIVPRDAPESEVQTRTYAVPPSVAKRIMDLQPEFSPQPRARGDFIALEAPAQDAATGDWTAFFKDMGVEWPAGASVKYVPSIGKLVVANTGDNLHVLDNVLNELNIVDRSAAEPFSATRPSRKGTALWALKGVSSLKIDLTKTGSEVTFQSLGTDPVMRVRLIHQRRTSSLAWAIAGLVFLLGVALTTRSAGRKTLYVVGVMVLAMAVPVLPRWAYLSLVLNHGFHAACWLVPYYLVASAVRKFAARRTGSVLGRSATAMLLAALSLTVLLPQQGIMAQGARKSEPYIVQVAPPPDPISVPADAIVVPYREDRTGAPEQDRIMVPYKRFRELWELAYGKEEAKKPPMPYALAGAEYRAVLVDGETLSVHGKLVIEVYGPTHAEVPLPLGGGVITSAKLDGVPAKLTSGTVASKQRRAQLNAKQQAGPLQALALLYVPSEGRHVLDITVDMKLTRRGGWRVAEGWVPVAPAVSLQLAVPDADTDVALGFVADRRAYKTKQADEKIETALPADGRFSLMWRPKISEGETDITLTASSEALFDVREDQLDLVWDLHLMFRRGERGSFSVMVPGDYVVEKVAGENVRGWAIDDELEAKGAGPRELKVDLLKRSEKEERFTLYLWKPGPIASGDGENIPSPVVAVPAAMRHTGKLTIRRSPLINVRTLESSGLRRTDLQTRNYPGGVGKVPDESPLGIRPYESYEFVAVPFDVKLDVTPDRADVDARVNSILRIAEDEHRLETRVDLTAANRPVHLLRIELPERFELEDVQAPGEYEWTVRKGVGTNELTIYFAAGMQGEIPVVLRATSAAQDRGSADIPVLTVLAVGEQRGDMVIQADPAYDVRTENLTGLEAILMKRVHGWLAVGQRPLARLAFHYRKPGYTGRLLLSRRKADVTCRTISNIRVTDKAVEETVLINFSIRNAGIRQVQFRLPSHLKDARISAPLLREKKVEAVEAGKEVRVTLQLQDEVMDELGVLVESDRLLNTAAQTVIVPFVETGRTDRQYVTLENAGRDELVVEKTAGLEPLGRQQKEWAMVAPLVGGAMTSAYIVRTGDGDVELTFKTKQRVTVETAGARIGLSQCVLIIDGEGAYRGEQTYHVDNQTEQFLEIELPEGASLWTAVVAGKLVKPVIGDPENSRHVRVPLVKTAAGDLDYTVLLKFGGRLDAIKSLKETSFPLLRTRNVNVELTQLELRLPRTHRWGYFDGSMRQVTQAGDFEAGVLSYQTKLAKRLVKTLQYGNVFEKARAVSNLKGVQQELQVYQEALNINPQNDALNIELSNAGDVLGDARKELERVEKKEGDKDGDGLNNRYELNAWFVDQKNTLGRNKVLQGGSNWDEQRKDTEGTESAQKVFNHAWLGANGLVIEQTEEDDQGRATMRLQEFGGQAAKSGRGSAKAPAAYQQVVIEDIKSKSKLRQRKGKGQIALGSRYREKLEKQQSARPQSSQQFLNISGLMPDVQEAAAVEQAEMEMAPVDSVNAVGYSSIAVGGLVQSRGEPVDGTGLASLDVKFPSFDEARWARYRFTTPLGEARVTARSVSESALAGIKRFGLVVAFMLVLWIARQMVISVRNMQGGGPGSGVMRHLPNILIVFGMIDLMAGVLPVAAFWAFVLGIAMKIRRAVRSLRGATNA